VVLIGLGLYIASSRAPENDFGGVLDEVDRYIGIGELAAGRALLQQTIEPNLPDATDLERARYHATIGDWLSALQEGEGVSVRENNEAIDEHYAHAAGNGPALSSARLERWTRALIDLGKIEAAREASSKASA